MQPPKISSYRLDRALAGEIPRQALNAAEQLAFDQLNRQYQAWRPELDRLCPSGNGGSWRTLLYKAFGTSSLIKVGLGGAVIAMLSTGVVYLSKNDTETKPKAPLTATTTPWTLTTDTQVTMTVERHGLHKTLGQEALAPGDIVSTRVQAKTPGSGFISIYTVDQDGVRLTRLFPAEGRDTADAAILVPFWDMPYRYFVTESDAIKGFLVIISSNPATGEQVQSALHQLQQSPKELNIRQASSDAWLEAHLLLAK